MRLLGETGWPDPEWHLDVQKRIWHDFLKEIEWKEDHILVDTKNMTYEHPSTNKGRIMKMKMLGEKK